MHPTVKPHHQDARPFQHAAEEYLGRKLEDSLVQDRRLSIALARQIEFSALTQGFIAIPVHVSERTLEHYLATLTQSLQIELINICLLVNATLDQCTQAEFDSAWEYHRRIARRWNLRMGRNWVAVLGAHLDGSALMGRVRRILTDALLVYALQKGIAEPVIVCNDIDQKGASKTYLADILTSFRTKRPPALVAGPVGYGYVGSLSIGLPSGVTIPELYLFNRIQNAINQCARNGLIGDEHRIWPEGANMAFTAAAYCEAGGFRADLPSGEDDDLGWSLNLLTNSEKDQYSIANDTEENRWGPAKFLDSAWIATDPRRVLSAILAGRTGMEAWSWERFDDRLGTALDTTLLSQKCMDAEHLVNKRHLEKLLLNPQGEVWEFVTQRIQWNFFRSIVFDIRTRDFRQLLNVSETFGLKVMDGELDRDRGEFQVTLDWDRSGILKELVAIFGPEGLD